METKKILIIGAGISGLSLALYLKMQKIPFRIIEKKSEWNMKGLAMSIQGEGISAAYSLGIMEDIKTPGKKRNLQRIENSKGKILKKLIPEINDGSFIIRRDVIHEALRSRVQEIEMGLSVRGIKEKEQSVEVTFSDESTDNFSLIVGADGINSSTLSYVSKKSTAIYSGSALWGIEVDKEYDEIIEIWDKNSMCALYPVDNGTVISFFRKVPKSFASPVEERANDIKKHFSSYKQECIIETLNRLPNEIFFDHVRYTRPDQWSKGRVTLIGDACHSLSPLSGLGANLAMADAQGLAGIIQKYEDYKDLIPGLKSFNEQRKVEADKALSLSKLRTIRGMAGFPENLIRNNKMNQSPWVY